MTVAYPGDRLLEWMVVALAAIAVRALPARAGALLRALPLVGVLVWLLSRGDLPAAGELVAVALLSFARRGAPGSAPAEPRRFFSAAALLLAALAGGWVVDAWPLTRALAAGVALLDGYLLLLGGADGAARSTLAGAARRTAALFVVTANPFLVFAGAAFVPAAGGVARAPETAGGALVFVSLALLASPWLVKLGPLELAAGVAVAVALGTLLGRARPARA